MIDSPNAARGAAVTTGPRAGAPPAGARATASTRVRWLLAAMVLVFYLLHQDIWFWRDARPVVFGVLPVGLFYHACYTLAVCGVVAVLVRFAWPSHLDDDVARDRS